jgi:hypothetical protein
MASYCRFVRRGICEVVGTPFTQVAPPVLGVPPVPLTEAPPADGVAPAEETPPAAVVVPPALGDVEPADPGAMAPLPLLDPATPFGCP